jgi:hypothetical protein
LSQLLQLKTWEFLGSEKQIPQIAENTGKSKQLMELLESDGAPKAGGLPKTTVLFSTFLLKQNNLVVIVACSWLCANVPICLLGGHKNWHT